MPSKKHRPEEIIGKLREAEVVLAQGTTTAEACRRIAVFTPPETRLRRVSFCLKYVPRLQREGLTRIGV